MEVKQSTTLMKLDLIVKRLKEYKTEVLHEKEINTTIMSIAGINDRTIRSYKLALINFGFINYEGEQLFKFNPVVKGVFKK